MNTDQLYGFCLDNLEAARDLIEGSLGVELVPHESLYYGGDYYRSGKTDEEHFILRWNVDLLDNEPAEPEFPEFGVLLYVGRTTRPTMIEEKLTFEIEDVQLLRQR